jgi:hypothetical protein
MNASIVINGIIYQVSYTNDDFIISIMNPINGLIETVSGNNCVLTIKYDGLEFIVSGDFIEGRPVKGNLTINNGSNNRSNIDFEVNEDGITYINGIFHIPNDYMFNQLLLNFKFSGNATLFFPNGNIYDGDFVNNNFSGYGSITYVNGDNYEGGFLNNNFNGKGVMIYPTGDVYEGDFVDNKFSGHGKLTFSNGDVYEGGLLDNKINGNGIYHFSDGNKYITKDFCGINVYIRSSRF